MGTAALITWLATVLAGIVLLVIWLMEYDRDFQTGAATRLPVLVISTHALLGVGGAYGVGLLPGDRRRPARLELVAGLGVVVVLGLVMAARWVGVYRAYAAPGSTPTQARSPFRRSGTSRARSWSSTGLLALATITLVVFDVFFSGS